MLNDNNDTLRECIKNQSIIRMSRNLSVCMQMGICNETFIKASKQIFERAVFLNTYLKPLI